MATSFVVEDGSGLATANSYLSLADAKIYYENYKADWVATWDALGSAAQEEALRIGTQYMDNRYGGCWRGTALVSTQALDWPRTGAYTDDDYAIPSDAVPAKLEYATAEMAYRQVIETDGIMPDITNPGGIKRKKVKVGPLEQDIEYAGSSSQIASYRTVSNLIKELIWGGAILRRC